MGEVGLWRLRVIAGTMTDSTVGGANREPSTVELVTGAVPKLGGLVDDLIESGEDVISELHLGDGGRTSASSADGEASDTLL